MGESVWKIKGDYADQATPWSRMLWLHERSIIGKANLRRQHKGLPTRSRLKWMCRTVREMPARIESGIDLHKLSASLIMTIADCARYEPDFVDVLIKNSESVTAGEINVKQLKLFFANWRNDRSKDQFRASGIASRRPKGVIRASAAAIQGSYESQTTIWARCLWIKNAMDSGACSSIDQMAQDLGVQRRYVLNLKYVADSIPDALEHSINLHNQSRACLKLMVYLTRLDAEFTGVLVKNSDLISERRLDLDGMKALFDRWRLLKADAIRHSGSYQIDYIGKPRPSCRGIDGPWANQTSVWDQALWVKTALDEKRYDDTSSIAQELGLSYEAAWMLKTVAERIPEILEENLNLHNTAIANLYELVRVCTASPGFVEFLLQREQEINTKGLSGSLLEELHHAFKAQEASAPASTHPQVLRTEPLPKRVKAPERKGSFWYTALQAEKLLSSGKCKKQADLARHLGLSPSSIEALVFAFTNMPESLRSRSDLYDLTRVIICTIAALTKKNPEFEQVVRKNWGAIKGRRLKKEDLRTLYREFTKSKNDPGRDRPKATHLQQALNVSADLRDADEYVLRAKATEMGLGIEQVLHIKNIGDTIPPSLHDVLHRVSFGSLLFIARKINKFPVFVDELLRHKEALSDRIFKKGDFIEMYEAWTSENADLAKVVVKSLKTRHRGWVLKLRYEQEMIRVSSRRTAYRPFSSRDIEQIVLRVINNEIGISGYQALEKELKRRQDANTTRNKSRLCLDHSQGKLVRVTAVARMVSFRFYSIAQAQQVDAAITAALQEAIDERYAPEEPEPVDVSSLL